MSTSADRPCGLASIIPSHPIFFSNNGSIIPQHAHHHSLTPTEAQDDVLSSSIASTATMPSYHRSPLQDDISASTNRLCVPTCTPILPAAHYPPSRRLETTYVRPSIASTTAFDVKKSLLHPSFLTYGQQPTRSYS